MDNYAKASTWFKLDRYRQLENASDFNYFKLLCSRCHVFQRALPLISKSFIVKSSNTKKQSVTNIERERDRRILRSSWEVEAIIAGSFLDPDNCLDEDFFSQFEGGLAWPISIASALHMANELEMVEEYELQERWPNLKDWVDMCRFEVNEMVRFNELEARNLLYAEYAIDSGISSGVVPISIDLSGGDDDILAAVKGLLPELRRTLNLRQSDKADTWHAGSRVIPPTNKKRDTGLISIAKAKKYRVLELIDLTIWSLTEKIDLTAPEYLSLVFSDLIQPPTPDRLEKTHFVYLRKCMNIPHLKRYYYSSPQPEK